MALKLRKAVEADSAQMAGLSEQRWVYDPGGKTCLLREFVVGHTCDWSTLGKALLDEITRKGLALGGVQVVVVCEADQPKQAMLQAAGLTIASEWYQ